MYYTNTHNQKITTKQRYKMRYSIITINYNNKNGLRNTIKSVISQSYTNYEYIIIDGGSTDESTNIIKHYSYKINYWVSEQDKGIYNAMNKGIAQANGEYLIFLNSGDVFFNEQVLKECDTLLDKDIVVGNIIRKDGLKEENYHKQDITMMHLFHGYLPHQATFFRRELFNKHLYDEKYKIASDWKFYIQQLIFNDCSFKTININIAIFDCEGISFTNKEITLRERKEILQNILPKRIYMDYIRYEGKESPLLDLIPILNKTYRLHKFVVFLVKSIIKIYNTINKEKK